MRTRTRYSEWQKLARSFWKKEACWIDGDGPWALLAHCRVLSVSLHRTKEGAEKAMASIDHTGCGGACNRMHEIVYLDDLA